MSVLLGLGLGTGLLLMYLSFWPPSAPRSRKVTIPPLRRLLDEAGHQRISTGALVLVIVGSAALVFLLVFALTQAPPVAACFAVFAGAAPWAGLRWQARRRRAVLADVWPDAVDHLRSAVRSGLSLPEALIGLGNAGPQPLREPFAEFGRDWRSGQNLEPALRRLKDRLADPVGDRIIAALLITREVGGTDLGRLLGTLSEFLRQNARTRSELSARQSWITNAAKLAVAAPWVIVLLMAAQPAAAEAYSDAAGTLLLGIGLVVSVISYHSMLRIGRLSQERRVLV
ncbi:type II secretion system F family protein [Nesterenkonia alba]|uniref:type II secretion system F family protein n=1 Tax=Nesterenkonia alba TaxID=515814 RepID=UPI0003B5F8C1|nr:type II secretion system F family protein [Nesterenkonia alba]